mmetsp:Transcript_39218/g.66746  ORF Transcript_39218/g.66746 Transcript_39218/m.66746 type:complete len:308 (-) Transcript_39218:310-1233(-)
MEAGQSIPIYIPDPLFLLLYYFMYFPFTSHALFRSAMPLFGTLLTPLLELLFECDHCLLKALGLERPHLEQRVLRRLEIKQVLLNVRAEFLHDRSEATQAPRFEEAPEGRIVILAIKSGLLSGLEHLEHAHVPVLALQLVEVQRVKFAVVHVAEIAKLHHAEQFQRFVKLLKLERRQPSGQRRGAVSGVVVEVVVADDLDELAARLLPAALLEKLHAERCRVRLHEVYDVFLHVAAQVEKAFAEAVEAPRLKPEVERGRRLVEVDGLEVFAVRQGLLPVLFLYGLEPNLAHFFFLEKRQVRRGHHIK